MASRRSGLGRGLGALIPSGSPQPVAEAGADQVVDVREKSAFREVDVKAITPNTYQPRKDLDEKALEPLSASIKELGVLQPLLVRESGQDRYELIAGERRWRAAQKAGLTAVPVIVREAQDLASLEEALVENLHRKDLNPLDEASAYRQLIDDFSMTHDQVGKRVGKSRAAITNLMRLLQLPATVQRLILEGHITEGHARALLAVEDQALAVEFAERAARESMSVRAVEEMVKTRPLAGGSPKISGGSVKGSPQVENKAKSPAAPNAAVLEWQERLSDLLDTRVTISAGSGPGRIVVDFADLADLDRIGLRISNRAKA